MPFVVSLYHGIKRQVNGKIYCISHKKKEQSYSIKSVAVLLLFRDFNQAQQTDTIIFSLSLTSERLHLQADRFVLHSVVLSHCRKAKIKNKEI